MSACALANMCSRGRARASPAAARAHVRMHARERAYVRAHACAFALMRAQVLKAAAADAHTALTTIDKMCENVIKNPNEPKYRRVQ